MRLDHAAITGLTAMLMRDLRFAVRTLLRNQAFTLVATGSLGLAIGGSMAVFTLLHAVVPQNASSHDGADTRKPWPAQETIEWLSAFVRVPRGTDPSTIASALTAQRQREADAFFSGGGFENMRDTVRRERILLEPASRGLSPFRENVSSSLFVLLAMMGVLLAIACGNVAGLLIARASARER